MKFLVTGATGFVGSHLSRRLVRDGHTVLAVSRRGRTTLIEDLLTAPTFHLRHADLADYQRLVTILEEGNHVDGIFHVAAQVPEEAVALRGMIQGNVVAMGNLLEAAYRFQIPKLIISSTMSVYGTTPALPVTEATPTNPTGFYGLTKLQAEEAARAAATVWPLHVVCLRYCSIFGVGNTYSAMHLYTSRALQGQPVEVFAGGRVVKEYTAVSDVVEANLQAFERADDFAFELFNIGGGEPMKLGDIAELVVQAAGQGQVLLTDAAAGPGVADFAYDLSKARRLLHYRPLSLADRIREYVEQLRGTDAR